MALNYSETLIQNRNTTQDNVANSSTPGNYNSNNDDFQLTFIFDNLSTLPDNSSITITGKASEPIPQSSIASALEAIGVDNSVAGIIATYFTGTFADVNINLSVMAANFGTTRITQNLRIIHNYTDGVSLGSVSESSQEVNIVVPVTAITIDATNINAVNIDNAGSVRQPSNTDISSDPTIHYYLHVFADSSRTKKVCTIKAKGGQVPEFQFGDSFLTNPEHHSLIESSYISGIMNSVGFQIDKEKFTEALLLQGYYDGNIVDGGSVARVLYLDFRAFSEVSCQWSNPISTNIPSVTIQEQFNQPVNVKLFSDGNLYVADSTGKSIRKVNPTTGATETISHHPDFNAVVHLDEDDTPAEPIIYVWDSDGPSDRVGKKITTGHPYPENDYFIEKGKSGPFTQITRGYSGLLDRASNRRINNRPLFWKGGVAKKLQAVYWNGYAWEEGPDWSGVLHTHIGGTEPASGHVRSMVTDDTSGNMYIFVQSTEGNGGTLVKASYSSGDPWDHANYTLETIVGDLTTAFTGPETDGTGTTATLEGGDGIIYVGEDANGVPTLYLTTQLHNIRYIEPNGVTSGPISDQVDVTTPYGTGSPGTIDGFGNAAAFNRPTRGVIIGNDLIIGDMVNHNIRKINLVTTQVTTLAGEAGVAGSVDTKII